MSTIELEWDQSTKLFRLPILVGINNPQFIPIGGKPLFTKALFYLDTGSSVSGITDEEISKISINVESLPTEQIAGIGGFTQGRILYNVTFTVFANSVPKTVNLPKVNVMPSKISKKVETGRGIYKKRGEIAGKMINLVGIDFLEALKGVISLDFTNKKGEIKF